MDIQKTQQRTLQEGSLLSDSEISAIKARLAKSKCSESDWDYIKALLCSKNLFTIRPIEQARLARFSIEGILYDMGALQVFTDLEDCEEYAKRYAAVRIGRSYKIDTILFENIIRTANTHEKDVYIDIRQDREGRFFVYSGKTKKLHLCINHR